MSNQPEPDYKAIWDELKDFAKKAPPHEPAWHIAWGAVVEKMRDLETLSAQGEQGTDDESNLRAACEELKWCYHNGANDHRFEQAWQDLFEAMNAPTPTAQEPPTETQERC